MKTYTGLIENLPENGIFVFGANTQGIHGAGTAKIVLEKYGAKLGSTHLQGQSYGLITVDFLAEVRPSIQIERLLENIIELYEVATLHKEKEFYVAYTADGFNLSGYTSADLAQLFGHAGSLFPGRIPDNIVFEDKFYELINRTLMNNVLR